MNFLPQDLFVHIWIDPLVACVDFGNHKVEDNDTCHEGDEHPSKVEYFLVKGPQVSHGVEVKVPEWEPHDDQKVLEEHGYVFVLISRVPHVVSWVTLPHLEFLPLARVRDHADIADSKDAQDLREHQHNKNVE